MAYSYDTIAPVYDRIARAVYGNTLINAQLFILPLIRPRSKILIAGGGGGAILEELTRLHPSGLSITYIDSSPKMITLSKQRNIGNNKVTFIAAPVQELEGDDHFDVVLTPFLLDNFSEKTLAEIFVLLDGRLANGGLWLYCDFQNGHKIWQKLLLKTMYLFFKITCGIEAGHLADARIHFTGYGYQLVQEKYFLDGFVISAAYKKAK